MQKPNTCSCSEFQAPRRISAEWWDEQRSLPFPAIIWGFTLATYPKAMTPSPAPPARGNSNTPSPWSQNHIPQPQPGWKQLGKALGGGSRAAPSEIQGLLSQLAGETRYREVKSPSLLGPGYSALQDMNSEELYLPREEVEPFPFPPSFRKDRTPPEREEMGR